jgi:hypothetical protein
MNFTGLTYRYFSDTESGTFVFRNFYINALETIGQTAPSIIMGLTGYNLNSSLPKNLAFTFTSGRIYDPSGRFFGSYTPENPIILSGNFSGTPTNNYYTYYLNNDLISSYTSNDLTDAIGWFVSCNNGASAQGDVFFYGAPIPCTLTYDATFPIGGIWNCYFKHQSPGQLGVVIRSGKISDDTSSFIFSGTGLTFNSGNILFPNVDKNIGLQHTGDTTTGYYGVGLTIYTDFGPCSFNIYGASRYPYSYIVFNDLSPANGHDFTGLSETYQWGFSSSKYDLSGNPLATAAYVELSYTSGYTGTLYEVIGFNFSNSGAGYTSSPIITVIPLGSGYPIASGSGLISDGKVTGISWYLPTGVYTTTSCTLSFSGGGGTSAAGTPLFSSYTKTFLQSLQLYTGLSFNGSGSIAASSTTMYSGNASLPTGQTVISLLVNQLGYGDTLPLQYRIKATGLPDTYSNQSIYSYTGLDCYNPNSSL